MERPPEFDELCDHRQCCHIGEDKGTYTPGKGYTSYYKNPIPCCMVRLNHGCPNKNGTRIWPDWNLDFQSLGKEISESKATNKAKKLMKKILSHYKYSVETMIKNVKYLEEKSSTDGTNRAGLLSENVV